MDDLLPLRARPIPCYREEKYKGEKNNRFEKFVLAFGDESKSSHKNKSRLPPGDNKNFVIITKLLLMCRCYSDKKSRLDRFCKLKFRVSDSKAILTSFKSP